MKSVISDLTSETVGFILKECEKDKNKQRIEGIINNIITIALDNIKPYLYTIIAILVLFFLINFLQFYYYIKLFVGDHSKISNINMQNINLDDIITNTN